MSHVHIEVSPNGRDGKVVIDGHDIAKSVTGFNISAEVGHRTRLELDLNVRDVTTFESEHVRVLVDPTAAGYLERAGWTPPPGVESVLERDKHGCPCEKIMWQGRPETAKVLGRTVPTCPIHGVDVRRADGQG